MRAPAHLSYEFRSSVSTSAQVNAFVTVSESLASRNSTMVTTSGYSRDDIAAMSLDQLRHLSDLQLSERELADVIEAIHIGGARNECDNRNETSLQPADEQQCALCQTVEGVDREHCLICRGGGNSLEVQDQLQYFAQWLEWYSQYKQWAYQQGLT